MIPPTLSAAILEGSKDSKQAIGRYFDDGRPGFVDTFKCIWMGNWVSVLITPAPNEVTPPKEVENVEL